MIGGSAPVVVGGCRILVTIKPKIRQDVRQRRKFDRGRDAQKNSLHFQPTDLTQIIVFLDGEKIECPTGASRHS